MTISGIVFSMLMYLASKQLISLVIDENFLIGTPDPALTFTTTGIDLFQQFLMKNPLFLAIIGSILAGFFISEEYQTGVMKNALVTGRGRGEIYFAKYLVFSLGVLVIALIFPVVTSIGATFLYNFGDIQGGSIFLYTIRVILLYVLHIFAFTSIITGVAFLFKDSGKTISITLVGIGIIYFGFMFLMNSFSKVQKIYEYTIFYRLIETVHIQMTHTDIFQSILIALFTLLFLSSLGVFLFKRKDVQ